ncbi:MAG: hypothetical protein Q7J19_01085 [Lutibacter sp.]|nr:hypothetical protein [Lutibacter sp.]
MKNLTILIAFLAISNIAVSQNVSISVSGNWAKTIAATDISEAGNDYPTSYESNTNQTLLSLNPNSQGKGVNVYVTRSDIKWQSDLILEVKRNSNGGNSSVTDGLNYKTIINTQSLVSPFFSCIQAVTNMTLQYRITGISVLLPVDIYSTTITYTVMYQ